MANYGTYGAIEVNKYPKDGVLYTNLNSGNLFLSESDMLKTVRIGVTNDYSVCLPDAKQLNNKRQIIIVNTQSLPLVIRDVGNNILTTIYPYESVMFWCTNISSNNGTWSITVLQKPYRDKITSIVSNTLISANPYQIIYLSICALDSNTAIIFSNNTSKYAYARLVTIAGTTITIGNLVTVASVDTMYHTICALTSTTAVAFYSDASTYSVANVLTVSGTTITVGTPTTVYNATSFAAVKAICALDSTKLLAFHNSSTAYPLASVLTVSGTNITVASTTTVYNTGSTRQALCALDSSTAIAFYKGASNYSYANVLTISGTTISVGGIVTVSSTVTDYQSICTLNPTTAIVSYASGTSMVANILTIAATAITVSAPTTIYNTALIAFTSICALNSTTAVVSYIGASSYCYANILSIAGTVITIGTSLTVNSGSTNYIGNCILNSERAILTFSHNGLNQSYAKLLQYL